MKKNVFKTFCLKGKKKKKLPRIYYICESRKRFVQNVKKKNYVLRNNNIRDKCIYFNRANCTLWSRGPRAYVNGFISANDSKSKNIKKTKKKIK